MKKLATPLVFVLSMVVLGASAVLAQTSTVEAERPLTERIQGRTFPSVFQAWSPAENVEDESPLHTVARHDLIFHVPQLFRLRWNRTNTGLADGFSADSIARANSLRQNLLTLNPNLVLIAEIRYRDAYKGYLPEGHKWWLRDEKGEIVPGWEEGDFLCLDFHNPEFRSQVARQAKAAVDSGAVDGVMLDWWSDDPSRLALIQEVRKAIGEKAIILANANDRQTPQTAPYINGYFMECTESKTAQDWKRIADNGSRSPVAPFFRKEFPSVGKSLREVKRKDYRKLAHHLQKAEADFVIHSVCYRLMLTHPDWFVGTIHDSIRCLPNHGEEVRAVMLDVGGGRWLVHFRGVGGSRQNCGKGAGR